MFTDHGTSSPEVEKYNRVIETLRRQHQSWMVLRFEEARLALGNASLNADEMMDAFGSPEINPEKADVLLTVLAFEEMI